MSLMQKQELCILSMTHTSCKWENNIKPDKRNIALKGGITLFLMSHRKRDWERPHIFFNYRASHVASAQRCYVPMWKGKYFKILVCQRPGNEIPVYLILKSKSFNELILSEYWLKVFRCIFREEYLVSDYIPASISSYLLSNRSLKECLGD